MEENYIIIPTLALGKSELSIREWVICENIEFLSQSSENGYTDIPRAELAIQYGLSVDRLKYIVVSLIPRGFLENNQEHHLRVGEKWEVFLINEQIKPFYRSILNEN